MWGYIKKINSNFTKSLDTLIEEKTSSLQSTVNGVNSNVTYVKNTQLGTDRNNLISGATSENIDFKNKPLTDKVNYLLLNTNGVKLSATGTGGSNVIFNVPPFTLTQDIGGLKTIWEYQIPYSGTIRIETQLSIPYGWGEFRLEVYSNWSSTGNGLVWQATSKSSETQKIILGVSKGGVLTFKVNQKNQGNLKFLKAYGDITFPNLYRV